MPSSDEHFHKLEHEPASSMMDGQQILDPKKIEMPSAHNIVTVDVPKVQSVQSFRPDKIKQSGGLRYSDVLKGAQDPQSRKNARFKLNELSRTPLSVTEEEEARIAQEVSQRLEAKILEIRAQTTKEAYAEGILVGKKEGKQEVISQAKPSLEAFETLIKEFEAIRDEIFKANEQFLIHMVYQLAKAVILKELREDTDYIKRLVVNILNKIGTRENIKIFVGEKDYSAAEQLKADLAQTLGQLKNINVELEAGVVAGGCRVETDFGEVDARIELQIQSIAGIVETQ